METAAVDRLPETTEATETTEAAELIELTPFDVVPVRPRRARLAALAIASFTGLTCLGLAATAIGPRFDRRLDPRADIAVVPKPGSADPARSTAGAAVVATAVTTSTTDGRLGMVHVSGAALGAVERIDLTVLVGGRAVGETSTVLVGGASAHDSSGAGDAIELWSGDVSIPLGVGTAPDDGLAIVEVSWTGPNGSGGPTPLIVALGDGRDRSRSSVR
jgi:hypothetical protein